MDPTLAFHGGAGTVTGSKFLIEAADQRMLVDCGLFQGLKELRLLNWRETPFSPRSVDAVILTHAHIDHSGYLPRLVKEGFRGHIYCTPATAELAEVLLLDAAKLQEEDAAYANRKGYSKHRPALPLYTTEDAHNAIRRLRVQDFGRWLDLEGTIGVRFHNAGHILGSAVAEVNVPTEEGHRNLVFSGDLGRYNMPLHVDPDPMPHCDTLVLESTYGDRLHDPAPLIDQLRAPFERTIKRGGVILIPAFAVARVQLITLMLRELMEDGELPEVPIHIDSPMATDVTRIYGRYLGTEDLDAWLGRPGRGLFPQNVRFHHTVDESRTLNDMPGPRIIVSSSGMLTGGRVLHHLERLAPHKENLIVLAGYQAVGTRGRALEEGAKTLRMHGQDVPVRAEVISLEGFSAHADAEELARWVETAPEKPKTIFLAHGEPQASQALGARLRKAGHHVVVPALGQRYRYLPNTNRWREE